MIEQNNFFALTGGPGAGKTTLVRALQARGEACVEEAARWLIQDAARRGVTRPLNAELGRLMLERDIATFRAARGRTFFDRSIVDAWATAKLGGAPCPAADEAVRSLRYNLTAFIAPPWRAIYVQDAERIQTWAEAIAAHDACAEAYEAAGYELVTLPLVGVGQRAAFVLDVVRDRGSGLDPGR